MRDRITIQQKVRTNDEIGGFTESWTDVVSVFAEVRAARASERYFAQKLEEMTSHVVRLRYREGLDSSMRIQFRDRILKMVSQPRDVDGRRRFLEISCEEGTGS